MTDNDWEQFEADQFQNTDQNVGQMQNQISSTPTPKVLKSSQNINDTHFTFQANLKGQSQSKQFYPPLSYSSATLSKNTHPSPSLPYQNKEMSNVSGQINFLSSSPHIMTQPNPSFPTQYSPQPAHSQTSKINFQNLPQGTQLSQDGGALSGGRLSGSSSKSPRNFQGNVQTRKTPSKGPSSLSRDALSEQEILSQLLKQPNKSTNMKMNASKQSLINVNSSSSVQYAQTNGKRSNNNTQIQQSKQSLAGNAQQQLQEDLLLHVPDQTDDGAMMCQQDYTQAVINVLIGDPKGDTQRAKKQQKELVKSQLERFEKTKYAKQRKIQKMKEKLIQQENAKCTFQPSTKKSKQKKVEAEQIFTQPCQGSQKQPQTSINTSLKKMRSLDQFLQAQNDHQKRIQAKIKRQQEEKQRKKLQQIQHHELAIDKTSRRIVEEKRKKDAENRALRKGPASTSPPLDAFQRLYKRKPAEKVRTMLGKTSANQNNKSLSSHRTPSKSEHLISQSSSPPASARKHNERQPDNKQQKFLSKQQRGMKKYTKCPLSMIDQRTKSNRIASSTTHLYQDAKRRQKKMQEIESAATPQQLNKIQNSKSQLGLHVQQHAPNLSLKSQQVILTRFLKNFKQSVDSVCALNNIFSNQLNSKSSSVSLNYMQMQQILRNMGYMKQTSSDSQKQLLDTMWRSLLRKQGKSQIVGQNKLFSQKQNSNTGIKSSDFQAFLEAIQGLSEEQSALKKVLFEENAKNPQSQSDSGLYGCHIYNDQSQQWSYYLTQKQIKKIKIDYNVFGLNRRDHIYNTKNAGRLPKEQFSFKPKLISSSKHISDDQNRDGNIVERLARAASPSTKIKEMEEEIAIKREQECTFKPKTLTYKKPKIKKKQNQEDYKKQEKTNSSNDQNTKNNKWDNLYSQAKVKKNKQDDLTKKRLDQLQAQLEKQCTFKPKLIQSGNNTKRKTQAEIDVSADDDSSAVFQLSKSAATSLKPTNQVKERDINGFLKRMEKARALQMAIKQSQAMGWTLEKFLRKKDQVVKKSQSSGVKSVNSFKLSSPSPAITISNQMKKLNNKQKKQKQPNSKEQQKQVCEETKQSMKKKQNIRILTGYDDDTQANPRKTSKKSGRKSAKSRNKRLSDPQNQNRHTIPQSCIELTSDDPTQFLSSSQLQINSLTPVVAMNQIQNSLLVNEESDEIQSKLEEIAKKNSNPISPMVQQMGPFKISPTAFSNNQGNSKILVSSMTPPPPSAKSVTSPAHIQLIHEHNQQDGGVAVTSEQPSIGEQFPHHVANNTTTEQDEDSKLESPADESQATPLQSGRQMMRKGDSLGNSIESQRGSGVSKRITVFQNDTAEELAEEFSRDHNLDASTKVKLTKLLQSQMNQLLTKIEEGEDDESESDQDEEDDEPDDNDYENNDVGGDHDDENQQNEDTFDGGEPEQNTNQEVKEVEEENKLQVLQDGDASDLFASSQSIGVQKYMSPGGVIAPLNNHADSDALLQASPQLNTEPSEGGKISQIKSELDNNFNEDGDD